jgi:hypothetical protein
MKLLFIIAMLLYIFLLMQGISLVEAAVLNEISMCIYMGTGGPFPGIKHGQGLTLTTHPLLVPRSQMSRSYISSPPKHLHGV